MATTRFWKIEGSGKNLNNVLNYVMNPEKTVPEELRNILHNVINYVADDSKTECAMYVSGVNCSSSGAYNEMMNVKEQFGKTDGIVAWHGYMSFEEGEVTPDEAHEIGLKFAELNFKGFQVVVTTHLNTDNIHNHFVVNSVSYENGKRIHDEVTWFKFHKLVDRLCREYGKSVVNKPVRSGMSSHHKWLNAHGRNESINILRAVLDEAISASSDLNELGKFLRKMGYRYNLSPNRKYWTVTPMGYERGIRLYHLGDSYTNTSIVERLADNRKRFIRLGKPAVNVSGMEVKRYKGKKDMVLALYRHYMYVLGKYKFNRHTYIPHRIRQDVSKLRIISAEAVYLKKNNITKASELLDRIKELTEEIEKKNLTRKELRNEVRRKDNKNPEMTTEKIRLISEEIVEIRKEIKTCESILNRSAQMYENTKEAEQTEERMVEDAGSRNRNAACRTRSKDNA